MRTPLLALALIAAISSSAQVALHGLYTPVHLQHDTTTIYLRDYLADLEYSEIDLPEGISNHTSAKDTLVLTGKLTSKMGTLGINTNEGTKQLVLINSSVEAITFNVPVSQMGEGELHIIGNFNNWNRESTPMSMKEGSFEQTFLLEPGTYEYKFYRNGQEILDPTNSAKVSNGMGGFNNVIKVGPESESKTPSHTVTYDEKHPYAFNSVGSAPNSKSITLWNNTLLSSSKCTKKLPMECIYNIPEEAKSIKRSYIRLYSFNDELQGSDILIPLEYGKPVTNTTELERSDWHQARMYFLMVDRFNNGDRSNDLKTPDPAIQPKANYFGGDLVGVDQKVESGFFDSLHVNTIWLSPITQNPLDAWGLWDKGEVHSKFSSYHGYWPTSNIKVDFRFGNDEELHHLLDDAHSDNKNVVLDYVANHVHINHPVYQNHKDWATDLYLPDGSKNTEKWDEQRLTTWFDDHLPTLDLRQWKVVDPMVDSAMYWLNNFSFDGFRHDATKHIDELYWRTLTYRIRETTDKPIFQIGETYGSPQLINSYISTGMLDAQFDFNLYDAAVSAFAGDGKLSDLKNKLDQGLAVYGSHHLMGNITGNQDRSRFISLASGDVKFDEDQKKAGWDREIPKPGKDAYKKLALLHAFNNAIPGIPCIYYGDEFGLPGAHDPDNRRMMKFEGLDSDEKELQQKVIQLNKARAENLALIYGSTDTEDINENVMIITRKYLGEECIMVINISDAEQTVPLTASKKDNLQILLGNGILEGKGDQHTATVPPLSYLLVSLQKNVIHE